MAEEVVAGPRDATSTLPAMPRPLVERRLDDVVARLRELRKELGVADEQLAVLNDEADDARLRALVSETPMAAREHDEARRRSEFEGGAVGFQ